MTDSKIVDIKPRGHKAPLQLLPYVGLCHVACAMEDGMVKYELDNWRGKTDDWANAYTGAGQRHLWELADRDHDALAEDTGVHHAAHAAACCLIALFHTGSGYKRPSDATTAVGQSPAPLMCQPSGEIFRPSGLLKSWRPRFDLLPFLPLCAVAGALESRSLREVGDYRELLSQTIEHILTFKNAIFIGIPPADAGQTLAFAAAGCLTLLSWPGEAYEYTVRPSLNVIADAFLDAGSPKGVSVCPQAVDRMRKVRVNRLEKERDSADRDKAGVVVDTTASWDDSVSKR